MRKENLKILVAVCLFMMKLTGHASGRTINVPADFTTIQSAIDDANDGDKIEVYMGEYHEAIDFNGKAIHLYSSLGPHMTVINGGLTAYHVVQCVSGEGPNTILEGFTITGGNANGTGSPDFNGGGMLNIGSSPTVINCIFQNNYADYGGGMYNGYGSSPTVTNCTFYDNRAHVWGAGMFNGQSNPTVTNCEFLFNDADWDGGGMFNGQSSPTVTDCNFINNIAAYSGGGMYSKDDSNSTVTKCTFSDNAAVYGGGMFNQDSSPTVINCTFSDNPVDYGGGMFNETNSSPTVTDCYFINNIAAYSGGGMYSKNDSNSIVINCTFSSNEANGNTTDMGGGGMCNLNNSNPALTNCTFSSNYAAWEGGGMWNYSNSSPTVINCTFYNNTAFAAGGGMCNWDNSSPKLTNCIFSNNTANWGGGIYNYQSNTTFTNCTFAGNSANTQGGVMNNYNSSNPSLLNCILWGNVPDQIADQDYPTSTTTVSFSNVQGGWPGMLVIDSDPLFVDAAGGDLRLSSNASPCVDTGAIITPGLPATDLAGNPRVVDGDRNGTAIVDMGAYEYQSWLIHNVTQDNWYETIQAAIDASSTGDEIEVAPGIYNEAINFNGEAVRLYSSGGPEVTTIDGTGNYHVVQCVSGEDANTILEGFTITGGNANGSYPENSGGGMYNSQSSPTVANCMFSGNSASWDGGGMYNYQSSPTLTDCTFIGNKGSRYCGGMHNEDNSNPTVTNCIFSANSDSAFGGGMSNLNSSPVVTSCNFIGNSADDQGGGMYNENSSPTVTNCTFSGNSAVDEGGGMNNKNSSPTVTNCTFRGNTAGYSGGGGGMYNSGGNPRITNCTLIGNSAPYGGGISNLDNSNPTITNCILWGNAAMEGQQIYGSAAVTYSDVEGGRGGAGNIDADPCFVDAAGGNLRLKPDSPCIDAGNSTAVPLGISLDLDENPRILEDPQTPDTGFSILGAVVDMGTYEFHPCPLDGDINCDGVVDFKDVAILCNNWLAGTEPEL